MFSWLGLPAFGHSRIHQLEVIHYPPEAAHSGVRPLLFLHGAYAGAWCWEEHFLPYFSALDFDCHALSLRGHGKSDGHDSLHCHGIDDYVADLRQVVESMPVEPILIGHSMGGMVIQKYLEQHSAPAVVLMASVPANGLSASVLQLMTTDPWLFAQTSLMHAGGMDMVDVSSAGRAVFSDNLDSGLQRRYASRMQGESQRALFDMTFTNLPRHWRMHRSPMLVIGAEDDALFTAAMIRETAVSYNAELVMIPELAHAVMLDTRWRVAAEALAEWLAREPAVRLTA